MGVVVEVGRRGMKVGRWSSQMRGWTSSGCLHTAMVKFSIQGVVTAMYPVLPSATAIKIFDG